MKIAGIEVTEPHYAELVLPRGDKLIPFRAQAVLDFEPFIKACPEPEPPVQMTARGKQKMVNDKGYLQAKLEWERRRNAWMVLKSLEPSQIEWVTVDIEKPGTWANYIEDLLSAKFSMVEINRIIGIVQEANCLDEEKLEWARQVFAQGQQTSH